MLASPLCFVLEEPCGFVMGRVVAGEAELLTIAVDPVAQGQGVGTRLMVRFLHELRSRGAVQVFLEVAESNTVARALYTRAGFTVTGRRRGYFSGPDGRTEDALVMAQRMAGLNPTLPENLPDL